VFAAASLTGTFTRLGRDYERRHPGSTVRFSFGGSSGLAQQIRSGAPADVFAAASPPSMRQAGEGAAARAQVFAANTLQIAVPADNPGQVTGLADLARDELAIALCAEQVPCGAATLAALRAAGVTARPDTLEQDVKAALTKVVLGEADAALVYRTDVLAAGGAVRGITFPQSAVAATDYSVAVLPDAPHPAAAAAFVALLQSPTGQRVLREAGFAGP